MSIWGVDQSVGNPQIATAGSDVACSAGVETNVLSITLPAASPGLNLAILVDTMLSVLLGATAPSAMVVAMRVGAGADVDTYTFPPGGLVNSALLQLSPTLTAVFARGSYASGSTLNVTVNPTGQAVTVKAQSRAVLAVNLSADS